MKDRLTQLVQAYHDDGADTRHTLDSAADTLIMEQCEDLHIDLTEDEYNKFMCIMRCVCTDYTDWEAIAEADEEARAYEEAKRSAIYE